MGKPLYFSENFYIKIQIFETKIICHREMERCIFFGRASVFSVQRTFIIYTERCFKIAKP